VDVAVFAAAVADWRPALVAEQKMKKGGTGPPALELVENPDILRTVARHATARPRLVIGFAAETEKLEEHARAKLARKGCDWIVVNDVSPAKGTFGGDNNEVTLIRRDGAQEAWAGMSKAAVAEHLVQAIAREFGHA
jgi:phosphopantothenoylcysteine decarboxylase/phosphopantothenate--cysteine ligase